MKDIKISDAKEISERSEFPAVVILGHDPETGEQHVTTYGQSKADCLEACAMGNWLKRQLGWAEEDCRATPSQSDLDNKE